jgi:hypothetical protein
MSWGHNTTGCRTGASTSAGNGSNGGGAPPWGKGYDIESLASAWVRESEDDWDGEEMVRVKRERS